MSLEFRVYEHISFGKKKSTPGSFSLCDEETNVGKWKIILIVRYGLSPSMGNYVLTWLLYKSALWAQLTYRKHGVAFTLTWGMAMTLARWPRWNINEHCVNHIL